MTTRRRRFPAGLLGALLFDLSLPHEGRSEHGCLVLDVFSPPRADYAASARAAARERD